MAEKNNNLIKSGSVLIAVGLIGIIFPFLYGYLSGDLFFLQKVADGREKSLDPVESANMPAIKDRLIINQTGVNMPVFLSDNSNVLWKGGWLFPSGSRPDLGGNTIIFGHRFRYLPPISNTFFNLDRAEIGDEFSLKWAGVEYKYEIIEKKIIEPTDMSVTQPTKDDRLTLVTCAPLFSTKLRLVVVGVLIAK